MLNHDKETLSCVWHAKLLLAKAPFCASTSCRSKERAEQAAQASRAKAMLIGVDRQIVLLDELFLDSKSKVEEYAQVLAGSVSALYDLEGETSKLQQSIVINGEDITQILAPKRKCNSHGII